MKPFFLLIVALVVAYLGVGAAWWAIATFFFVPIVPLASQPPLVVINTAESEEHSVLKSSATNCDAERAALQAELDQMQEDAVTNHAAYTVLEQQNADLREKLSAVEMKAAAPQLRDRYDDLPSAIEAAKLSGRKILILFTQDGCQPCYLVERDAVGIIPPTTQTDQRSIEKVKKEIADRFVFALINVSIYPKVGQQFKVPGCPNVTVYEPDHRALPGFTPSPNPNDFIATLKTL